MEIISLGQSCFIKMNIVDHFTKSQQTHLFDWSITTPDVLLDCINTNFKYYHLIGPCDEKYKHILNVFDINDRKICNKYGNCFIHHSDISTLEKTYKRRSDRFIEILNSNKKAVLIYCNYSYLFSDVNINWKNLHEKQDEYFKILEECAVIILSKNPSIKIISINTNKKYESNLITVINLEENLLSQPNIDKRKNMFFSFINYKLKGII